MRRKRRQNPTLKMSWRPEYRPMFLLFLVLFVSSTAAQPPLPQPSLPLTPPPSQSVSVNFNLMVTMLIALTFLSIFFVIFFSVYIIDCTSSPPEPAARAQRASVPKGLDWEVIMSFPTFVYSDVKEHKMGKGVLECAICLREFEDYEMLRLIPKCDHVFHPECIDEWLSGHVTCPVCRANLDPLSGYSVKDRADGSGAEEHDHVEIDIDEPTVESEEVVRGRDDEGGAEQSNRDLARESCTGKPPRRLGRSHSTGHSLVRPREDTERFTLRLPEEVRRQIMERPMTPYFPGEGSSRRGFRSGDGSSRGRFLRRLDRLDRLDRLAKSERWVFSKMPSFLTRVSSTVPPKSPKLGNNDCRAIRVAKSTAGSDPSLKSGEPAAEHDRPICSRKSIGD